MFKYLEKDRGNKAMVVQETVNFSQYDNVTHIYMKG